MVIFDQVFIFHEPIVNVGNRFLTNPTKHVPNGHFRACKRQGYSTQVKSITVSDVISLASTHHVEQVLVHKSTWMGSVNTERAFPNINFKTLFPLPGLV
jgi:hypothetical protein